MRITDRQIRQIIREELARGVRESRKNPRDVTGYEHLRKMPNTVTWRDGEIDDAWVAEKVGFYKENFPPYMMDMVVEPLIKMLEGIPQDPDVVKKYNDGRVTRQSMEALVAALTGG